MQHMSQVIPFLLEGHNKYISRGGLNPNINDFGYVCFIRKDPDNKDIAQRRFGYYRREIMVPFFKQLRIQHDNWVDGTEIPPQLTAVSWCDEVFAQIQSIIRWAWYIPVMSCNIKNVCHANRHEGFPSRTVHTASKMGENSK